MSGSGPGPLCTRRRQGRAWTPAGARRRASTVARSCRAALRTRTSDSKCRTTCGWADIARPRTAWRGMRSRSAMVRPVHWHSELVASVAEPVASWASVARYCIAQPQRTGVLTGTLGLLTGTLVYASRTLDALDRVDEIVPLRALLVRPQQRIASAGFHAGTLPPLCMRVADTWTALSRDKRARARLDRRATVARERNARRSDGRRRIQAETPQRSLAGLRCGGCSLRWRHAESRARFRRTS